MSLQRKISVMGLGYVGLTIAAAFGQITEVIAFDTDPHRISELKASHDANDEVSGHDLASKNILFTCDPNELKKADFHIISVPTPLDKAKHPDLSILLGATETLARQLKKGDIVVYESTVYPGATEEKCIPLLEKISELSCGKDFSVGYSPERINPADKGHQFSNIVKVISATDKASMAIIAKVYSSVIKAGVFPVSSLRIAEACKVIENTQRDINIALMNDIAMMLHSFGMDTKEVIEAMNTKWNALNFQPGLVGGHCIGVNSFYLMHKAEEFGYHSEIIAAGRQANESIAKFIVDETIKQLIHLNVLIKGAKIAILGITYKENCPDIRDSRVLDIINAFKAYELELVVLDPIADARAVKKEYGIRLTSWDELSDASAIIVAVAHKQYAEFNKNDFMKKLKKPGLIMDIKKVIDSELFKNTDITVWSL